MSVTLDDRILYCGVALLSFFIGNVFSTKDYSVKDCCYWWKSVGVIVEVGVDCGEGHVG